MSRINWKRVRPTSLVEALRLCKAYALERKNLSVERIADLMGVSRDNLYKWLGTGRMPANLIPAYEHTCGAHFVSDWLAASAGRMAIPVPTGRRVEAADMVELNSGFAQALQLLTDFYAAAGKADPAATLDALQAHLQQVAFHQHNVATYATPELDLA